MLVGFYSIFLIKYLNLNLFIHSAQKSIQPFTQKKEKPKDLSLIFENFLFYSINTLCTLTLPPLSTFSR